MKSLLTQLDQVDGLECEDEQDIIEAFMERYDVKEAEAREIFEETKKWLWLASKREEHGEAIFIDRPLLIIDEMWHNFILHTRQYYDFCLNNFKRLIHHRPTPVREKRSYNEALLENPTKVISEQENRLKKQYSLVYDNLGPETLVKWYDSIAQKYTPEYIESIKK